MTTATLVTSATFTQIAKQRVLPSRDRLVGSYILGGSAAESIKNRANPALPLTEVGVVSALTKTASGSGGTDGTYNLIFTGGTPTTAATGTFVVVSGAVTTVTLSTGGKDYHSAPTVDLSNCPGLTGATVTATRSAPTYNAHSASVRSHATTGFGFQTGIIPDEDYTLLCIRKICTIAGSARVAGMSDSASGATWSFREFGTNNYGSAGDSTAVDTTGSAFRAKPSAGAIFFEAITHNRGSYTVFNYGLASVLTTASNAAAGVATLTRTNGSNVASYSQLCIGSTGLIDASSSSNSCEVFFFAAYNRCLSQAEIAAAYAALQAYYSALSVTVV